MPCYDKKLEASRKDFFDEQNNNRDVDCVITASILINYAFFLQEKLIRVFVSVELQQMLEKTNTNLETLENGEFSEPWSNKNDLNVKPQLIRHEGSGSGGYADHIFKFAAKELFGTECEKLQYKNLR